MTAVLHPSSDVYLLGGRRLLPLTVDQKSLPDAPAHRHHEYLFVMFMHLVLTDCRLLNYYLIEPRLIWWQGSFSNDDDRSFVCLSVACREPVHTWRQPVVALRPPMYQ